MVYGNADTLERIRPSTTGVGRHVAVGVMISTMSLLLLSTAYLTGLNVENNNMWHYFVVVVKYVFENDDLLQWLQCALAHAC